ncbi:MAG: hypothetical protein FWE98_08265 [Oscillospiraceae bacterium]|nr:hypothetical protein [Oscillospiraceae bacterium]
MKMLRLKNSLDPLKRLFWKTQISFLRACPPVLGAIVMHSLGASHSRIVWVKALLRLTLDLPGALFAHCENQRKDRVVLPRVSFGVTTRCTLNCDKCLFFVPDIRPRCDFPLEDLALDLERLLADADYIYSFMLTGGEAFLHPELDKIIGLCAASDKIGDISVQTNGTVVPDAKVLAALRKAKALVKISKYPPSLQPCVEELKRVFTENGVRYIHSGAAFWNDMGYNGQVLPGSQERRFSVCIAHLCMPCLNGKLYRCVTAAYLNEYGRVPCHEDEYIDLRTTDPAAFRAKWRDLMRKQVLTACSYCLGQTYNSPKIPVAVQRPPRN